MVTLVLDYAGVVISAYAGVLIGFYAGILNWLERGSRWENLARKRLGSSPADRDRLEGMRQDPPRVASPKVVALHRHADGSLQHRPADACKICEFNQKRDHALRPHRPWHSGRW